ncbi:hypothetical protein HMPREF3223_01851 [Cutibacterium avidum]|nr:hypothetical protein HMPREF3223_01851 [Cutibacterium avidum]
MEFLGSAGPHDWRWCLDVLHDRHVKRLGHPVGRGALCIP